LSSRQAAGDRTAIITGASRGIGAATAVALAELGIAPALFVRDAGSAESVAQAVRDRGMACHIEVCDVADHRSVCEAVARTIGAWGHLDIVINNAGRIDPIGYLADTDPAEWSLAFQVNVIGAYHVIRETMPFLLDKGGVVINLSTGAAHTPRDGWSAYCSSKAALAMLTRSVANEYADKGVFAYGLQPGLVDTEMQVRIRQAGINEISRIPRSQLDQPDRSAKIIAWLASERPPELAGMDLPMNHPSLGRAIKAVAPESM
jgi:NAD(P)-dependent dehydrogenase (short-subunit alcohol dehydrogenase family)